MNTISQNDGLAGTVHNVLTNKKTRWKCREISLTCHVKGHLVEPWQAERYTVVRTMRRIMIKRPEFRKRFTKEWINYIERKRQGYRWKAHGPISVLAEVLDELGWDMDDKLTINRGKWTEDEEVEEAMMEEYGNTNKGLISLWKGEDGYFDHVLREDLRAQTIKESRRINKARTMEDSEFVSIRQIGIDYGSTMEVYRAKYSKPKPKAEDNWTLKYPPPEYILVNAEKQEFGCTQKRYILSSTERGMLRSIQTGGVPTGHRLRAAFPKEYPNAFCLNCKKEKDDTTEHAFWDCKALKEETDGTI
jgi:hypothetical protein